ncbi:MAG TPA: tRNA1(Val) (adenine(37)-N6)-methyltransferase [Candidatus Binatia bacterium]|nr:tRNA1(Val) (adenine(37)-N6)-methyltransferase [Candidatus Binatia bacterium]
MKKAGPTTFSTGEATVNEAPRATVTDGNDPRTDGASGEESRDETLDALFHGRLKVYQSRRGFRSSLDSLLAAFFVTVREGDKIMDLGSGNGAIALVLAALYPSLSVVGLELQSGMVDRAGRNIRLNRYEHRVSVVRGDVRAIERIASPASFDAVVCNPPYRTSRSGRLSAEREKTVARHEIEGTLDDFVAAGAYLLPAKGRLAVVYHAARTVDLLQSMRKARLEPKRLRMVHSFTASPASLALVEGVKGGRSEIQVLAPLVVYRRDRSYTAELKAMLEGKRI